MTIATPKQDSPGKTQSLIKGVAALAFFFMVALASACGSKTNGPISTDAKSGYCPVCSMKVDSSDQYACEIVYNDGTKLLFESQGDLLHYYFAPEFAQPEHFEVTPAQSDRKNIVRILVKDYASRNQIEARQAFLVYKSRIQSPMGLDMFAFTKREDAERFVSSNGGKVVTFAELTPEMALDLRKS